MIINSCEYHGDIYFRVTLAKLLFSGLSKNFYILNKFYIKNKFSTLFSTQI